ncbi:MAG: RNA degradosome polyphosphate kinase, partial [Ignavibacteriaceae bacterium]|nr:RNA degradosome polyphosphate kinase [Ignavibacteriaceae bacterium]
NIRVRSIVGRFLEHHRVFYFYNNGAEDVFISSADLMQRNLSGRVEVATPILSPEIKSYLIKNVLNLALADNVTARILDENMNYFFRPVIDGEEKINYQQKLIELH